MGPCWIEEGKDFSGLDDSQIPHKKASFYASSIIGKDFMMIKLKEFFNLFLHEIDLARSS